MLEKPATGECSFVAMGTRPGAIAGAVIRVEYLAGGG
jgi:hypothetical protein